MLPGTKVGVLLVLAIVSVVLGMMLSVTVTLLLAPFESRDGATAPMVAVFWKVLATLVTLARASMTTMQVEPTGAAVRVPVTCVRAPTTALRVVHVPPPLEVAVILKTGVIKVGITSMNVTVPAPVDPAPFTTVKRNWTVSPSGTDIGLTSKEAEPVRCSLTIEKSFTATWNCAWACAALLPAVVLRLPAGMVFR